MAVLAGCPLVIHEQNSIAGLANRVLSKVATRVVCGLPQSAAEQHLGGQSRSTRDCPDARTRRASGRPYGLIREHRCICWSWVAVWGRPRSTKRFPKGPGADCRGRASAGGSSGGQETSGKTDRELRGGGRFKPTAWRSSMTWRAPTNGADLVFVSFLAH